LEALSSTQALLIAQQTVFASFFELYPYRCHVFVAQHHYQFQHACYFQPYRYCAFASALRISLLPGAYAEYRVDVALRS
jgi:hypothetical protein